MNQSKFGPGRSTRESSLRASRWARLPACCRSQTPTSLAFMLIVVSLSPSPLLTRRRATPLSVMAVKGSRLRALLDPFLTTPARPYETPPHCLAAGETGAPVQGLRRAGHHWLRDSRAMADRLMTYDELAEALGRSGEAVRALSSSSVVGQRMAVSLGVERSNRLVDGAVEVIRAGERLMSEVMPLEV